MKFFFMVFSFTSLLLSSSFASSFLRHIKKRRASFSSSFSHEFMERATRLWISRFVRDLNLCPFSSSVLINKSPSPLRIITSNTSSSSSFLVKKEFLKECNLLIKSKEIKTSIIIYPNLVNFIHYLDFYSDLESLLEEKGLDSHLQLASFHPNYIFQGEEKEEEKEESKAEENEEESKLDGRVTCYTNRSPFPMVHLLKVAQVAEAIAAFQGEGSTEVIWRRNMETMERLGVEEIKRINSEIFKKAFDSFESSEKKDCNGERMD